ncbi:hypothetical protein PV05_01775 [Exophiala xenobiotica]|uniref:Uncharacterized protein n=1 Tax=Exophiala xenobiotica TaxID=348802 RepID=A0A0D2F186_9EURO|nr:uncharacterized protein PV05_01775 [Exophiala xenobiotica]KIW61683.1 hypothetical protein PV05_01775 [Exophiala xenobiotica]
MISRSAARCLRRTTASLQSIRTRQTPSLHTGAVSTRSALSRTPTTVRFRPVSQTSAFHTSSQWQAQSPTADALMENLTDLYATAKDEFEIAAEETEKKTVYAADDREAAAAALQTLKDGFEKAVKESAPEVGKEIQSRVGQRIRELENAIKAMEERAMED